MTIYHHTFSIRKEPEALHRFLIWRPEDDEKSHDGREVTALHAADAAEAWAEKQDPDLDYAIVGGDPVTLAVKCMRTGQITTFLVRGVVSHDYYADEVSA